MTDHLSATDWLVADLAYAALLAGYATTGVWLRRRLAPGLTGSAAALATVCAAIFAAVVEAEVLGLAGGFRALPLVILALLVPTGLVAATRGLPPTAVRGTPRAGGLDLLGAAVGVALATAHWAGPLRTVLAHGFTEYDTLDYHLPFVASFVHGHAIRGYTYTNPYATSTYQPQSMELLDAVLVAPLHRTVLVPLMNLPWSALLLLAGWVAGRASGRPGRAGLGAAVAGGVLGFPVMQAVNPGEALTDIAAIALVAATAALAVACGRTGGEVALVAGVAGLAVGSKASALPIAGLILVVVLVQGVRARVGPRWVAGGVLAAIVAGGLWYGRNAVLAGNPVAPARVPGLPRADISGFDGFDDSVAHYVGKGGIFPHPLLSMLPAAWGHLWPLLVVGAVVLPVLLLVLPGRRRTWLLAVAALVGAAVYVVTPSGAAGPPTSINVFGINVRYLLPAVVVGFLAVAADPGHRRGRVWSGVLAVVVGAFVVNDLLPNVVRGPGEGGHLPNAALAVACLVLLAAVVVVVRLRPLRYAGPVALVVAVLAVATGLGVHAARHDTTEYAGIDANAALASLDPGRVGYLGNRWSWVAQGTDLRRAVVPLGVRTPYGGFRPAASCAELHDVVVASHVQAILVVTDGVAAVAPEVRAWVRADQHDEVASGRTWTLYRVDPAAPSGC